MQRIEEHESRMKRSDSMEEDVQTPGYLDLAGSRPEISSHMAKRSGSKYAFFASSIAHCPSFLTKVFLLSPGRMIFGK